MAKKNPPLKLGLGEYYLPGGPDDAAVWSGRQRFLQAVNEISPEVAEDLRDKVRPTYFPKFKLASLFPNREMSRLWNTARESPDRAVVELENALRLWANRFKLIPDETARAEWVLDAAVASLLDWEEFPNAPCRLRLPGIRVSWPEPEWLTYSDSWCWNPALQPERDFDRWVRSKFQKALEQYKKRASNPYAAGDWKAPPEKRKHGKHFRWLVYYQIRVMSPNDIEARDEEAGGTVAIFKAVQKTAKQIGLKLRPHQNR